MNQIFYRYLLSCRNMFLNEVHSWRATNPYLENKQDLTPFIYGLVGNLFGLDIQDLIPFIYGLVGNLFGLDIQDLTPFIYGFNREFIWA